MSGGSYDYLCTKADDALELLENRESLGAMLARLRQLDYAQKAATETEKVLEELKELEIMLNQIQARAENLRSVWQATEWWDSRDWSEEQAFISYSCF